MCVIFLPSATFPSLSILTQRTRAPDSSRLQCVVYLRPCVVVVLLLLGMLDGRPCSAGSCSASHVTHDRYSVPMQELELIHILYPYDSIFLYTNHGPFSAVRTQKSVGLVGGTPTYDPIGAFQVPDTSARTYQYSPDGRFFAVAVPSGCVKSRSFIDKRR